MRRLSTIILMIILAATAPICASLPENFFDNTKSTRLLETSVHLMAGGSTVMQNYKSTFPEIENLNTNTGLMFGAGARATFGLRGWLGLTTELNMMVRNYNIDLSVVGTDVSSMSAVFINSRTYSVSIPVLITVRFNVAHSVRWNIDLGPYYSYGFAGHQKQRLFVGTINELGQMVGEQIDIKSRYYNSPATFQNSFRRSDIGVHFGTSLDLGPHLQVGARVQVGVKNTSFSHGINNPSVRNVDICGMAGWRF